ncbi:MAG TPA: hypothetical protein VI653_08525, partial [Steroidobacteraceae bacterium]
MPDTKPDSSIWRLANSSGLRVEANSNGSLRRFDCNALSLALFVGNELEGGPANLFLRRRGTEPDWTPLLGPLSPTRFQADPAGRRLLGSGSWRGINYSIAFVLAQSEHAWYWHVELENAATSAQEVDLTYAQDVALAAYGAIRLNEYYVSQYLDHTPLRHPKYGYMVATRQNLAVEGRYPWCLIGSLRNGRSFATDAKQFHGLASRAGDAPVGMTGDLPDRRLQHEHAMVVIRDATIRLEVGNSVEAGFFGLHVESHPDATSPADADRARMAIELPEAKSPGISTSARPGGTRAEAATAGSPNATLFSSAPLLNGLDLGFDALRNLFGPGWRHEEVDDRGERLSFFHGTDRHVVLRAKELRVLRPHGHILRTGTHTTPDETALTSTVWMNGVFHSMVTQGHVSINRFLSTTHTYLSLFRSHGQRVFAEIGGRWQLLNIPSAFEIAPDACRWIYSHDDGKIEVRAAAHHDPQELTLSIQILSGAPTRFLLSHHVALNDDDGSAPGPALMRRDGDKIVLAPAPETDLGRRFPNGSFHIEPLS